MAAQGTMEITTVVGCPINCRFCPQKELVRRYFATSDKRELDFSSFTRLVEKLPLDVSIHFSGMSEPWSNPECTEMLLYAAGRGHLISVYSTLVGLTEAGFERMRGVQFNYFVIHVPDAEGNSPIPVPSAYLALLERVFDTPLRVRSERQISCHGTPRSEVSALLRGRFPVLDEVIDRAGNIEEGVSVPCRMAGRITCTRAGRSIDRNVLLPDGRVLLCCMDYGMRHVLGNLWESSYQQLLNGAEASCVRAAMDDESLPLLCRDCTVAAPFTSIQAPLWHRLGPVLGHLRDAVRSRR
jgi:hypothetical protein